MNRYLAEFLGTFCLVFIGTGAIITNDQSDGAVTLVGISIAFGAVVTAMAYSLGDVSGAHINPAVTIALWLGKQIAGKDVLFYLPSQIGGAIFASMALRVLFPDHVSLGGTLPSGSLSQSFLMEVLLTFVLMFVILNVGAGDKEKSITGGLIVGLTVSMEVFAGGPISGASMNPARSIGPAVVSGQLDSLWLYLVATTLGACLAVPVCALLRPEEKASNSANQT